MSSFVRERRIAVIGAGIVGCATAFRLAQDGHRVILIDAANGPALGTSFANGAQLSYSYVEPLATPGTLRGLPKMLFDADSPLRFRLRADPRQWEWGLRFLAACTTAEARKGTQALLVLAQRSRAVLEGWMAREPALADYRGQFAGGVWTADECVADPLQLSAAARLVRPQPASDPQGVRRPGLHAAAAR